MVKRSVTGEALIAELDRATGGAQASAAESDHPFYRAPPRVARFVVAAPPTHRS
jgi:hypothetical protein